MEPTVDFVLSIAANLTSQLISTGAARLRAATFGDAEKQVLAQAYQHAFGYMLAQTAGDLDIETQRHIASVFEGFVQNTAVANELLDLALFPETLETAGLKSSFDAMGFDPATLPISFDETIEAFVVGLAQSLRQEAIKSQSPLFNRVSIGRLTGIEVLLQKNQQSWNVALEILSQLEKAIEQTRPLRTEARGDVVGSLFALQDSEQAQQEILQLPLAVRSLAQEIFSLVEQTKKREAVVHETKSLKNYLDALRHYCQQLPYLTLPGQSLPVLSTIYIEQKPQRAGLNNEEPKSDPEEQRPERGTETLEQALRHRRHIILEGAAGTGKTTMLHHLALSLTEATDENLPRTIVPVLVPARNLALRKGSLGETLSDQVSVDLGKRLDKPLPADFFSFPPSLGATWLIMIDGLDEIVSEDARDELLRVIEYHGKRPASNFRFIITSRPLADVSRLDPAIFGQYVVRPFTNRQMELFARKWFASRQTENPDAEAEKFLSEIRSSRITELAKVPLLLTMAIVIYEREGKRRLPNRRIDFYQRFVKLLLEDEEFVRDTREKFRRVWDRRYGHKGERMGDALFSSRQLLLEHLAVWRQEGHEGSILLECVRYLYSEGLVPSEDDAEWVARQVEILLRHTGLLLWRSNNEDFIHRTFRDYLAALAFSRSLTPDDTEGKRIVARWNQMDWREIVLFLVSFWGRTGQAVTESLRRIVEIGERHSLMFCGTAMAEGALISQELDDRIVLLLLESANTLAYHDLSKGPTPLDLLGMLPGRKQVASGLLSMARNANLNDYVRERCSQALLRLGYIQDAVGVFLSIARDREMYEGVRKKAIKALTGLERTPELLSLARDVAMDPWGKLCISRELRLVGLGEDVAPIFKALVSSPNSGSKVRISATRQLRILYGDDSIAEVWVQLATDSNSEPKERLPAAIELARLKRSEAFPILLGMVVDRTLKKDIRFRAVDIIDRHGDSGVKISAWETLATDLSLQVSERLFAVQQIRALGGAALAEEILVSLTSDPSVTKPQLQQIVLEFSELRHDVDLTQTWKFLLESTRIAPALRVLAGLELERSGVNDVGIAAWGTILCDPSITPAERLRIAQELEDSGKTYDLLWLLLSLAHDSELDATILRKVLRELKRLQQIDNLGHFTALAKDQSLVTAARRSAEKTSNELSFNRSPPSEVRIGGALVRREEITVSIANALEQLRALPNLPQAWTALARDSTMDLSVRLIIGEELKKLETEQVLYPAWLTLTLDPTVEPELRVQAATELINAGTNDAAMDAWFVLAYDEELPFEMRLLVAEGLLRTQLLEDDAVSILLSLVGDPGVTSDVRVRAIKLLGRSDRTISLLELALDQSIDIEIRRVALKTIGQLGTKTVLPNLRQVAKTHKEREIRRLANHAIDRIGKRMERAADA